MITIVGVVLLILLEFANCDIQRIEVQHHKVPNSSLSRKRNTERFKGSTNLEPYDGYVHVLLGNITFGTPPQKFQVLFDLQSVDVWVIADYADLSDDDNDNNYAYESASTGRKKNTYSSSDSTTYTKDGRPFSADWGYVSGELASDIINVANIQTNITFGLVDDISNYYFFVEPVDGEFGLSSANMSDNNISSSLYALKDSLDKPIVSFHLRRNYTVNSTSVYTSTITLGNEDTENCRDEWKYVDQTYPGEYQFNVHSIQIGDKTRAVGVDGIIEDNGIFIDVGLDDVSFMAELTNATYNSTTNLYTLPCIPNRDLPIIQLNLGDGRTTVLLGPEEYILPVKANDSECYFGFVGYGNSNTSHMWYLGRPFLDSQCFSFNLSSLEIGFSPVKKL
ncbi:eukaryotic aspartyl protease domain-containing protein [Ditylenchus destructor]|uniref:Eukaryotic aspartyl protease domain-containing protein n=1 Tax=Ditylenchus destructor TaxID=166010 RepID=A0AAD4R9A4_9BILA|nr:eukaryotic aspartyl protease domain-containing protein [Ditylenchus destructor]